MKFRRLLPIVVLGSALSAVGTPVVKRVNPKTIPRHILLEITAHGCETKRLTRNDYVAIWYATVKARVGDVDKAGAYIDLQLRDAKTDVFLLNPGTGSHVEGGYLVASIAFNSTLLDQIVFQWRERDTIYEIYLRDFYSGERC